MEFGVGYFPTYDGIGPGVAARLFEDRGQDAVFFAEHTHIPAGAGVALARWGRAAAEVRAYL